MSDHPVKPEYLIHKAGRGWYRENSQGYTSFKYDAGRYTEAEAKAITHPNGEDGPRDGMIYRHESMVRDAPSDRIEELTAKLDACKPWLKNHQTPAERLEENHKETLALLKLLELEKRKTERLRDVSGD
jgi:hypothetical protein